MARSEITPQDIVVTGTTVAFEPANVDGNSVDLTTGAKALRVKNGDGSPKTVTLVTQGTVGGLAIADRDVVIPATTGDKLIRLDRVLKRTDGTCWINYSAVTSVTVAVLNLA